MATDKSDSDPNPPPPGSCPDPNVGLVGPCFIPANWTIVGVPDTFAYDQVGNRTDKGGSYRTGNRITAFTGRTYTTNAAGSDRTRTKHFPIVAEALSIANLWNHCR